MADVHLNQIQKSYANRRILADVNLQIRSGEYVALLGPSGCGKSTLLKIIAGLESPDQGELHIANANMINVPPIRRDVSMVFQHDALYPHLTIEDSIKLALRRHPSAEQKERVDEAVALTNSRNLLRRMPANLSGGELRRAAIAKAVARRAAVRLLDEPLSALDSHVRHSIQTSLLRWHAQTPGTTLHVTHDGLQAMRVADRIAVLSGSRESGCQVIQFASPEEIYRQPINKTVAMSVGTLPMNFVDAKLEKKSLVFPSQQIRGNSLKRIDGESHSINVGFRPDCVRQQSQPHGAGVTFDGNVQRTQFANGSRVTEILVEGNLILMESDSLADMPFFVAESDLHFFDAESGHRIR